MEKRRKEDSDIAQQWWHWIRPYWHVASFLMLMTFIAATKWSTVEAYGEMLNDHTKRISALEVWQAGASNNLAAMKQEVDDIHESVVGKNERP
jgi:hypothetical protein